MSSVSDIIVRWTPETSGRILFIQIQSRIAGKEWTDQTANFDPAAGEYRFTSNAPATLTEVRTRFRMVSGLFGDWVNRTITTAAVTVPYRELTGTPQGLKDINNTEGTKLDGVAPGADVTGNNTSKDTNAVGGVPSGTLIGNVNAALANQRDSQGNLILISDIQNAISAANGRITTANDNIIEANIQITDAKSKAEAARLVGVNAQQDVASLDSSVTTRFKSTNDYAADLSTRLTAVSDANGAIAIRTTTLEASYGAGGNLVPNSSLSTLDGWLFSFNAGNLSSMTLNGAGPTWQIGGVENNLTLYRSPAGTGLCAEALSPSFAVRAGSYLQGYALASSHRSQGWVSIFYYDAGGSMVGYSGENLNPNINGGGQSINAQTIVGSKCHQVPANAMYGRLSLRLYNVANDGYAWFARPFVTEVKSTTTEWIPYSAGNDRVVTVAANARITATETAITDGRFATAQRATNLETSVGNLTGRIGTVETVTTNGTFATAQRATNIETSVGDLNGRLGTVETVTTNGTFATAQRASNIETSVNNVSGRLSTVETVTTNGTFAAASTVSQLRSEYNGTAATVSTQAGTITGLQNRTSAYWQVQAVAAGNRAQMTLYADANGGAGVDIVGDTIFRGKVVIDNGTTMIAQGIGFGTTGQFLEWVGPSRPLNQCNEASALRYVKINGNAYFGGTLSAGVLKNAQQTTDTGATANITVGPFGSNGGIRTYVVSYSFYRSRYVTGGSNTVSGSPSATITLYKVVNGTEQPLVSFNATGVATVDANHAGVNEPGQQSESMGGSTTFTDNSGGTGGVVLIARLSGRGLASFGGSSTRADSIVQSLGIVGTEG